AERGAVVHDGDRAVTVPVAAAVPGAVPPEVGRGAGGIRRIDASRPARRGGADRARRRPCPARGGGPAPPAPPPPDRGRAGRARGGGHAPREPPRRDGGGAGGAGDAGPPGGGGGAAEASSGLAGLLPAAPLGEGEQGNSESAHHRQRPDEVPKHYSPPRWRP